MKESPKLLHAGSTRGRGSCLMHSDLLFTLSYLPFSSLESVIKTSLLFLSPSCLSVPGNLGNLIAILRSSARFL